MSAEQQKDSGEKEAAITMNPQTQMKPTPRPWKMNACHIYAPGDNGGNVCSMSDPRASTVVGYSELSCTSPGIHEAYANAELICRAVNSFDALVEACKMADKLLVAQMYPPGNYARKQLRAALALAESRKVPSDPHGSAKQLAAQVSKTSAPSVQGGNEEQKKKKD